MSFPILVLVVSFLILLVLNVPRIYYSPKYGFLTEKGYSYFFTFLRHDFLAALYNGGNIRWGHLWFVVYLFLVSLIALPLFILLLFQLLQSFPDRPNTSAIAAAPLELATLIAGKGHAPDVRL